MIALYVVLTIVVIYILYICVIVFLPVLRVEPQPFRKELVDRPVPKNRENVSFVVDGNKVSGWFYSADTPDFNGCIILSTGFNGTKDGFLEQYALDLNRTGFAVLTYDYRSYGESEGEPRQLLSVVKQQEDLRGAVKFIREEKKIDKIVLWGTSAGAPYGLIVASEDPAIAGVICQCGAYDHKLDSKKGIDENGIWFYLSLLPHGIRDKWRLRLGLSGHKMPAYGRSGTKVFLRGDNIFYGAEKVGINSENFINEVSASFMFQPHGKDVLKVANSITCPVLIISCEKDEIISPESHVRLMEILGEKARLVSFPIGHFEIYQGEWYEKSIEAQKEFCDSLIKFIML